MPLQPEKAATIISEAMDALVTALRESFPEYKDLPTEMLLQKLVGPGQLSTLSEYFATIQDSQESLDKQLLNAG